MRTLSRPPPQRHEARDRWLQSEQSLPSGFGHYYAGRGNEFWPMLYKSGVVPEPFDYHDDKRVIEFGVGLTDLVKRPTKGIEELKREDYAEGRIVLSQSSRNFAPHVVAFNGKLTYEQFAQRKCKFGIQKELLYGARVYVLPSTSGANATDKSEKLRHFRKLAQLVARIGKETRDSRPLNGVFREQYSTTCASRTGHPGRGARRHRHTGDESPRPAECAEQRTGDGRQTTRLAASRKDPSVNVVG